MTKERSLFSFSLRTLLVCMLVCCLGLAVFVHKWNHARQQTAAIREIQRLGGVVPFINTKNGRNVSSIADKWFVKLLGTDLFVTYPRVDLTSPALVEEDIRTMFPLIRKLTPIEGMNEAGGSFISIDVIGNPNLSAEFISEMGRKLPNCEFSKVTFVPKGADDHIDVGMSAAEVLRAVGEVMLQERKDWVWNSDTERQRCVSRLGSSHTEYRSPDGLETWTYFADEMGIAVLGIDFDKDGKVSGVWHDRGSPPLSRPLARVTKSNVNSYQ